MIKNTEISIRTKLHHKQNGAPTTMEISAILQPISESVEISRSPTKEEREEAVKVVTADLWDRVYGEKDQEIKTWGQIAHDMVGGLIMLCQSIDGLHCTPWWKFLQKRKAREALVEVQATMIKRFHLKADHE